MLQQTRIKERAFTALSGGRRAHAHVPGLHQSFAPDYARDAEISVEKMGEVIAKHGGIALVNMLVGDKESLKQTLTTAWNVAKDRASNPMTVVQAQEAAAELLIEWANQTGRREIAPYYKPAAQKLALRLVR